MWAYRLQTYPTPLLACSPVDAVERGFENQPANLGLSPAEKFEQDHAEARKLMRHLDWNGTVTGNMRVFTVPGPYGMLFGFIAREATGGRVFVASPIELPHLDSFTDWDGRTDSDEHGRTVAALKGEEFEPLHNTPDYQPWRRSQKGNLWTRMDGALVTVIADYRARGGKEYKALIVGVEGKKLWTPTMADEKECCAYVAKQFYKLTEPWRAATRTKAAAGINPFDWSDGDDDD